MCFLGDGAKKAAGTCWEMGERKCHVQRKQSVLVEGKARVKQGGLRAKIKGTYGVIKRKLTSLDGD